MILPSTGLIALSIPVATTQTAPISTAEKPWPSSARVASTISVPNSRAGRVVTQSPRRNSLFRNAPRIARAGWRSGGGGSNQKTSAISTRQTPATVENASRTPIALAAGADHGPEQRAEHGRADRSPHRPPAPVARGREREPGERARPRDRGADALDEPRAEEEAEAVGKRDADARESTSVSPPITAARAPKREATIPPGTAASRTPIAKAAARTPTPAFERSNSRRK